MKIGEELVFVINCGILEQKIERQIVGEELFFLLSTVAF